MKEQAVPIPDQRRKFFLYLLIPALLAAIVGVAALLIKRLREKPRSEAAIEPRPSWTPAPLPVKGLSEEQASARFVEGQDNAILFKPPRSRRTLIREGALTVFNLGLVAIALVQLFFGQPLDALITIGVLIFSVAVSVFQNEFAHLRLRDLYKSARPTATVIREGKVGNVDPTEMVKGDALAVGPGDLILADGRLVGEGQVVVDESMLIGESSSTIKGNGDPVFAGSFCLLGRGVYEAESLGDERLIVSQLEEAEAAGLKLTPIEQIVKRVMIIVLVLTFGLTAYALVLYFQIDVPIPEDLFVDAITVILNLAPASLFFMIVLTYTAATADLSKFGALVGRARSVESLSQVDVICFSKSGFMSATHLGLSPVESPADMEPMPDHRLRQLLGDYARTISSTGTITRQLRSSFEGTERPKLEEMPFPTIYGWSGLVIDDEDMRGMFILGEPDLLQANLLVSGDSEEPGEEGDDKSLPGKVINQVSSIGSSLTGLFRRSEDVEDIGTESADTDPDGRDETIAEEDNLPQSDRRETDGKAEPESGGFLSRLRGSVSRLVRRSDEAPQEETKEPQEIQPELQLIFAYRPEITDLYGPDGEPVLPTDLIPICELEFKEQVQPEAIDAARAFSEKGVAVKIFSPDPAHKITEQIAQAGFDADSSGLQSVLDGTEMEALSGDELARALWEHNIFSNINLDQAAQLTKVLRKSGHTVALIGDTVRDVPALLQANLTLIRHTSDPAALSVADIVLTDDSPDVISKLLDRGRRIVNGLVDVLKLYLTQIFYTISLIILIQLFSSGFPYTSAEGGMIAIFTLTIPAIGLSIWADKGRPPTRNLARLLTVFVIPASLTIAGVGSLVYLNYYIIGDLLYAQTVLTHALIAMGLLLIIYIHPPLRFNGLAIPKVGDIRPSVLALISAVLFFVTTQIPLAQELLKIDPMSDPRDYLIVGVASLIWVVVFFIALHITRWIANLFPSNPDLPPDEG